MSRAVFIKGEHVNLVPLTENDAEAYFTWLNDMEITVNYGQEPMPVSLNRQREVLKDPYGKRNILMLGIAKADDGALIGVGGLSRIEWVNQRAELTLVIGQADQQGKGYGISTTRSGS